MRELAHALELELAHALERELAHALERELAHALVRELARALVREALFFCSFFLVVFFLARLCSFSLPLPLSLWRAPLAMSEAAFNVPSVPGVPGMGETAPRVPHHELARHLALSALPKHDAGESVSAHPRDPVGEGMYRQIARVCTGSRHVTMRLLTMANTAEGVLTVPSDIDEGQLQRTVCKFYGCHTALLVPDEHGAMVPFVPSFAWFDKEGPVCRAYVLRGAPHKTLCKTKVMDEYARGDMLCPLCERIGPCRYTGHMYCPECKYCMFCCLVHPFCTAEDQARKAEGQGDELEDDEDEVLYDEDMTPAQRERRAASERAVEKARADAEHCAAETPEGMALLEEFYTWQERIMNPHLVNCE